MTATTVKTRAEDRLITTEVAALAGITPASLRRYRLRGAAPEPDGYLAGLHGGTGQRWRTG